MNKVLSIFSLCVFCILTLAACMPATQPPGSPTLPPATTSSPTAAPDTPVPATPTPGETFYESEVYGFRLQIPTEYRIEELPLQNGMLLALGFAPANDDQTQRFGFPLGLTVYEKPAEAPLLDWFSTHIGSLTESGQPTSEDAFFFDPIIQNQHNFKGLRALQYESGDRPVPYETVIDRGAWAMGFYYLRDYPDDFQFVYDQMLASLEFFDPAGGQTAAATQLPPTATPTVCLDESAQPRALPSRETPLEVRFISDGNVWVWEEESGIAEQISDTGDVRWFSFSPDGQVILIERRVGNINDDDYTDDSKVELWAVNRDGSDLRQLVSVEQFDMLFLERHEAWVANVPSWFFWTPGTHQVIFGVIAVINAVGADRSIVGYWRVDTDTMELKPMEQPPETQPGLLSPDGTQRAILNDFALDLVNADGSNLRENALSYITLSVGEGPGRIYPTIEWAHDSQSLLVITFSEDEYSPDATFTTWRIPVDGSPAQKLHTFLAPYYWTNLSPNQDYLAYMKRIQPMTNDHELHLAYFDGSEDIPYIAQYGVEFLHWHPDSYHFVYDQWDIFRPFLGSVCGGSVPLLDPADTPATQIQWVDAARFLFVKGSLDPWAGPRELRLGQIGGPSILIGPFNGDYAQFFFNTEAAPLGQE